MHDVAHRATVALLCAHPEVVGIEAAAQIYGPHVDHGQRMMLLDAMATAARAMHTPPLNLGPTVDAATSHKGHAIRVGTVRWRAERALESQRARHAAALGAAALDSALATRRNNAVLRWTYALLSNAAQVRHVMSYYW